MDLNAEVAQLEARVRSAQQLQDVIDKAGMGSPLKRENENLRAEVEQLRATLAWMVDATAPDSSMARVLAARKAATELLGI
jgi:regulator of replication initiation timing